MLTLQVEILTLQNENTLRIRATPINAKIGNIINIKANITNTTGNLVKESLKSDILLNSKKVATGIDINNGTLRYNYNMPAGTQSNSKITINIT